MIVPVVLYVSLTSGTADSTTVLANGARKEQKLMVATMTCFFLGANRSYIAGSILICELKGARARLLLCDTVCDKVASGVSSVEWMVVAELEKVEEPDDMGVDGASSFSSGGLAAGIVD